MFRATRRGRRTRPTTKALHEIGLPPMGLRSAAASLVSRALSARYFMSGLCPYSYSLVWPQRVQPPPTNMFFAVASPLSW